MNRNTNCQDQQRANIGEYGCPNRDNYRLVLYDAQTLHDGVAE